VQEGKDHLDRAAGCIQIFGRTVLVECARTILYKTYNMHFVGSWCCINVGCSQLNRLTGRKRMKDRATVLCVRDNHILLVARERSRWALPGGRIRRGEAPHEGALRELEEETTLVASELMYLYQFRGFNTLHHVFFADVEDHATAEPSNEIAKCRWFAPVKIATLSASVPTRGIVDVFLRHIGALEPASVRRP
jgi:8-oxo-dGTP diphosphatase